MISDFIEKKLRQARYKLLEDGTYFGSIRTIQGVWANAKNLEDCRKELQSVLEDWLVLKIQKGQQIPGFLLSRIKRQLEKAH